MATYLTRTLVGRGFQASFPYFAMLERWIYHGSVEDQYVMSNQFTAFKQWAHVSRARHHFHIFSGDSMRTLARYKEFMIRERKDLSRDELRQDYNANYWDKRYTIRGVMVPWFLKPCADQILTTGKYLNVIRGSDQAIRCPFAAPVRWSTIDRTFVFAALRCGGGAGSLLVLGTVVSSVVFLSHYVNSVVLLVRAGTS